MSFLDTLIYGYRTVYAAGVEITRRNKLNFGAGFSAVDNPTLGTTDVSATGTGGAPLANASTGALADVATTSSGLLVAGVRFAGAAPTVSGFASGAAGRELTLTATGGNLVLQNQNVGSAAANRIVTGTGASVTILNGSGCKIVYDATTLRWRLTGDGAGGGGGSTPTGTGLRKIVADVEDATASLLVNADVAVGAAIAAAKVVQATGTGLVKVASGVLAAASALLVDADVNAAAAIAGTKVDPDFGSQVIKTTGGVRLGGTPATSGDLNFKSSCTIKTRDNSNANDMTMMGTNSSDEMFTGGPVSYSSSATCSFVYHRCRQNMYFYAASNTMMDFGYGSYVQMNAPIIGNPAGVHGNIVSGYSFLADSNYTVQFAQYSQDWVEFVTGSWTSGHQCIFPHPSNGPNGYYKTIQNSTAYTITVSTGTGTTKTLATGLAQRFFFSTTGVRFAGNTFTP